MGNLEYTNKGVQGILERLSHFQSIKEKGNTDAIIIMVDVKNALANCEFTDRQKQVFYLRFLQEYTIEEVSKKLGLDTKTVREHIKSIVNKVVKALNGR